MSNIKNYMEHIERTVGGYYYEHNNGYEIMFEKATKWRMRELKGSLVWRPFSASHVVTLFNKLQLDLAAFELTMHTNILTHAAYCRMMIDKTKRLMGDEVVEDSFVKMDEFGKELVKAVNKTFRKSKLSLVSEE